jgi:high affinity sulfate transporter 1
MRARPWPPGLRDIASLKPSAIPREIGAGISVAAVAIPIGLAYSELVGVPPQIGLYASIVPTVAYALLGPSSRFLIVGPDAAICLLLATMITGLGVTAPEARAPIAAGLTLAVGFACIAASVLRVGSLANLISRPVLVGYLMGVSLTLFVKQLSSLSGVDLTAPGLIRPFIELVHRSTDISWLTLGLGVVFFVLLRAISAFAPRLPGPALVLVLGIILSALFGLPGHGVATVGHIPAGLPAFRLPVFKGDSATFGLAVLNILIVSFSSGILTARSFGARLGQPPDPNRELLGFGAAQIAAGLFQGFATTGADSRTAVAISSGGRTALVGLAAGGTVALAVSFLTGPLALLPRAALGAILASAAVNLFDTKSLRQLARIDMTEFGFALVTAAGVIWIGVLQGVFIAVLMTFAHLIRLAAQPLDGLMGRHPQSGDLVTLNRRPDAVLPRDGVVYLFEGSVTFVNAEYFNERVLAAVDRCPNAKWFVLDASPMVHADSSAVEIFNRLCRELDMRGIALFVGGGHGRFREVMQRSGVVEKVGGDRIFRNADEALRAAEAFVAERKNKPA